MDSSMDSKSSLDGSQGSIEDEKTPDWKSEKLEAIREACKWRNLDQLRQLAESRGGFLTDELRQQAWPILLGLRPDTPAPDDSWKELPRHKDEDQVQLDVDRAFVYYPNDQTSSQMAAQKATLHSLITSLLRTYPYLSYFQGYHDIAQVLLLILPPSLLPTALARLSILRIRDFMLPQLSPAIAQLRLIPDILWLADPSLHAHLSGTEPFFALSGTLTMYAHDITTLGEISRLFDVLLAREPVFTVYLFATIVISRRAELFEVPDDEPEMLHSILSKLPKPLDLDELIRQTVELMETYPPERLRAWRGISGASVLKTGRGVDACTRQTLEEGERWFERQWRDIVWERRKKVVRHVLWRYRRPVGMAGSAMLVGVVAMIARREGMIGGLIGWLARWVR